MKPPKNFLENKDLSRYQPHTYFFFFWSKKELLAPGDPLGIPTGAVWI